MLEAVIKIYFFLLLAAGAGFLLARRWQRPVTASSIVIAEGSSAELQRLATDLAHANAARAGLERELTQRTERLRLLDTELQSLRQAAASALSAGDQK